MAPRSATAPAARRARRTAWWLSLSSRSDTLRLLVGGVLASLAPLAAQPLPLLHLDDLRYAGAFRLPDDTFGSSELSYSEGPIAYHPGRHSIYIVGHSHHQAIAEFAVPALAESNVLDDLQMASAPLQAPADNSQTTLALRDADDLGGSAVKAGEQDPHEPRPYEHGVFPAVFPTTELGGGAFDPASGLLYLTLQRADTEQGTYSNPPVVVAYRFEVAGLFADGFESGDALAWSASPPE